MYIYAKDFVRALFYCDDFGILQKQYRIVLALSEAYRST